VVVAERDETIADCGEKPTIDVGFPDADRREPTVSAVTER